MEATQIIVIGNETIEKGYGPEKESTGEGRPDNVIDSGEWNLLTATN